VKAVAEPALDTARGVGAAYADVREIDERRQSAEH